MICRGSALRFVIQLGFNKRISRKPCRASIQVRHLQVSSHLVACLDGGERCVKEDKKEQHGKTVQA
jgi:hypothetical protein